MHRRWYAVRTRSRAEKVVDQQLQQKRLKSFLPTVLRWSRWKDRKKQVEWPLFPGYCFVCIAPSERLAVLTCVGVAGIVSFNGEPAPIPSESIESIKRVVESDLKYDPCPMIQTGQIVEVIHGPLKGVIGRLDQKKERARLVLSVELISQAVSVEVDAADVRPY